MTSYHTIESVLDETNLAAEYVANRPGSVDQDVADLVLRNACVATERLTPRQFASLGESTIDAVLDAAAAAESVVPVAEENLQRLSYETDAEYTYRIKVRQPLFGLQRMLNLNESLAKDDAETAAIKRAVHLGGVAFTKIVTDPSVAQVPGIQKTVGYFGGNASAAARRAKRHAAGE